MSLNVLLVDDSAVMRTMVLKTLQMTGIPLGVVHQAGNGAEGLELLQRHPVDLVMLDISMPVMRGDEMLLRMRAESLLAGVQVIVVSSERTEERLAQMRALGAVFIHKPFSPEQLRAVILKAMERRDELCTQ